MLARGDLEAQAETTKAKEEEAESQEQTKDHDGEVRFWRWGGEHLVRYRLWGVDPLVSAPPPSSSSSSSFNANDEPVLVLVHGFGASCDQWARLAASLRNPCRASVWRSAGLEVRPLSMHPFNTNQELVVTRRDCFL